MTVLSSSGQPSPPLHYLISVMQLDGADDDLGRVVANEKVNDTDDRYDDKANHG